MPRRRSTSVRTTVVKTATVRPPTQTPRMRKKGPGPNRNLRRRVPRELELFTKSAINPFQYAPPGLGYEVFTAPVLDTFWCRDLGQQMPSGNACVILDPTVGSSSAGNLGAVPSSFVRSMAGANNVPLNTLLSSVKSSSSYDRLLTTADQIRPITAALRVSIRYPATSAPGRLIALNLSDADVVLAGKSINDLLALDFSHPVPLDGSGVAIIQSAYRQSTAGDFIFRALPSNSQVNTLYTKTIVLAVGWPDETIYDVEAIAHLETLSGSLPGAVAGDDAPTLALSTSIEVLGAIVRSLPAILNKDSLMTCERLQLINSMRRGGSGPSGRSLGSSRTAGIPISVEENDFVDLTSTAGEFVRGVGSGIMSGMPSASTMGVSLGSAAATAALAYQQMGLRRQPRIGA